MNVLDVLKVGVLDIDICGPSIPKVMGLEGEQVGSLILLFTVHLKLINISLKDKMAFGSLMCIRTKFR